MSVLIAAGGGVSDAFLLSRLEQVMDPASRAEIRAQQEAGDPYHVIWQRLRVFFEKDSDETARSAWENCQLRFRGKMTSQDWREFSSQFLLCMRRCVGVSNVEALRFLRRQLPSFLAERLENERSKRQSQRRQVLIRGLQSLDARAIANWIQANTGMTPLNVNFVGEKAQVELQNNFHLQSLLVLNGCGLQGGGVLSIEVHPYEMDVTEAISLVGEWVLQKERVEEFRRPLPEKTQRRP